MDTDGFELDILVLDDASPDIEWSHDLAALCEREGIGYYRSPRNLGITRNVSLGLLQGERARYDHVVICNSDVLFPRQLIHRLLAAWRSDETIGSVTGWSNNVSIYSLPNDDPDRHLRDQDFVDWVSDTIAIDYDGTAVDVPAGVSFCTLFPAEVIRKVGVMDPVFGRGYCEETDWTLRSKAYGYRIALAPAAFVYHRGRGSTVGAGMVTGDETTVLTNEAIVDHRFPLFRSQVQAFVDGGILAQLHKSATFRILSEAGRQFGYLVEVAWLAGRAPGDGVRVEIAPEVESPKVKVRFRGFAGDITVPGDASVDEIAVAIRAFFGGADPTAVVLNDQAPRAGAMAAAFGSTPDETSPCYPTKV
jgi:hypothetical protein